MDKALFAVHDVTPLVAILWASEIILMLLPLLLTSKRV